MEKKKKHSLCECCAMNSCCVERVISAEGPSSSLPSSLLYCDDDDDYDVAVVKLRDILQLVFVEVQCLRLAVILCFNAPYSWQVEDGNSKKNIYLNKIYSDLFIIIPIA